MQATMIGVIAKSMCIVTHRNGFTCKFEGCEGKVIKTINYRLKLLDIMGIYFVFHISFFELVLPRMPNIFKTKSNHKDNIIRISSTNPI